MEPFPAAYGPDPPHSAHSEGSPIMRISFYKTPPKRALQRRGGVCDVYGGQDKAPAGASAGREARYVQIAGRSGGVWGRAPVTKSHPLPASQKAAYSPRGERRAATRGETVPHNKRTHDCESFCYEVPSRIELLYLVLQTSA